MGQLVENDVDTLHEERIHSVGTNYIGYIDSDSSLPLVFAVWGFAVCGQRMDSFQKGSGSVNLTALLYNSL